MNQRKKTNIKWIYCYSKTLILFISITYMFSCCLSFSQNSKINFLEKQFFNFLSVGDINLAAQSYEDIYQLKLSEDIALLKKLNLGVVDYIFKKGSNSINLDLIKELGLRKEISVGVTLLKNINGQSPQFQKEVISFFKSYKDPLLYPDISALLQSQEIEEKETALKILVFWKEKSFYPQVKKLLKDDDDYIRSLAISCIAYLENDDSKISSEILELTGHKSDFIRAAVVKYVSIKDGELSKLRTLLKDQRSKVIYEFLDWFEQKPSKEGERYVKSIIQINRDNSKLLEKAYSAAINYENITSNIDWRSVAKSSNEMQRLAAFKGLAKSDDILDCETILPFLIDSSSIVKDFAIEFLFNASPYERDSIINGFLEEDLNYEAIINILVFKNKKKLKFDSSSIVKSILKTGIPKLIKALIPSIIDLKFEEKKKIALELINSYFSKSRAIGYKILNQDKELHSIYANNFEKGLKDKSLNVKKATLGGLSSLSESVIEETLKQFLDQDDDPWLKSACLEGMKNSSNNKKIALFQKMSKHQHAQVRLSSLSMVSEMNDMDSIMESLMPLLSDENDKVRRKALSILNSPIESTVSKSDDDKQNKSIPDIENKSMLKEKNEITNRSRLLSWMKKVKSKKVEKVDLQKTSPLINTNKNDLDDNKNKENTIRTKVKSFIDRGKNSKSIESRDIMLSLGDEKTLKDVKNQLNHSSAHEKKKILNNISSLNSEDILRVLRQQLIVEKDVYFQKEICISLIKLLIPIKKTS